MLDPLLIDHDYRKFRKDYASAAPQGKLGNRKAEKDGVTAIWGDRLDEPSLGDWIEEIFYKLASLFSK